MEDNGKLNLHLSPDTMKYLQEIADTGLYGIRLEEVAVGLIDEGIRNAVEKNFIPAIRFARV